MVTRGRPPSEHVYLKMIFVTILVLAMSGICDAKSKRIADPDIPQTSFSCDGRHNGYYADVETDCRVYHMCLGHEQFSYLCPNTTRFQQRMMVCDHWYQVDCPSAPLSYSANLLIGQRDQPFVPDHEHPALHTSAKSSQMHENDNQPPPRFAPQPEQLNRSPAPQLPLTQTNPTARPQFFQTNPTTQPQFFQSKPTEKPQFIQSRQTPQQQLPTQPPFSSTPQRVIQQTQAPRFVSTPSPQPPKSQQSQLQFVSPPQPKASDIIQEKQAGNQRQVHSQFVPVFRPQPNELSDRQGKSLTTRPTSPTPSVELEAPLEDAQSPQAFFQRSPTSSFAQPYNVVSTTTRSPPTTSAPLAFTAPPSSPSTQRFTYKFSPSPVSSFQPVFQSPTPQPTTTAAPVTSPSTPAASFSPSPSPEIPDVPPPSRELLPPFLEDPPKEDLITSQTGAPASSPNAPEIRQPTPRRIAGSSSNDFLPDTPPPPSQELLPPELPNEALLPRPFGSLNPEGLSLFASTSGRTISTTPQTVFEASTPQPHVRSTPSATRQTPPTAIKSDEPSREPQAPEENDENFNTVEVKYQDVRKLFFIPRSSSHLPKEDPNQYTVVIKYPTADSIKSTSTMRFKTYSQSVKDRLNPSCPRCHPDFVVPGSCHPCVLLR